MFEEYVRCWQLVPDGEPVVTASSGLLPVRMCGKSAMLKVFHIDEEKRGGRLMRWWNGQGAAEVLAFSEDAIVMERASNAILLADMARSGRDDAATKIICATTAKLHLRRRRPKPADLVPLQIWFEPLFAAARTHGGLLGQANSVAGRLLAAQQDLTILHGDIHHDNILDFGLRGWLAIDPKALWGERSFDYANILCNPDHQTAMQPGRLMGQIALIARIAHLDSERLLAWVAAWAALSAAFLIEDGFSPDAILEILGLATAELRC